MNRLLQLTLAKLTRASHAPGVKTAPNVQLTLRHQIDRIGAGSTIDSYARISSKDGGQIRIGERCEIGFGVHILSYGGDITIGDDCSFNPYCVIYGHGGLRIGNSVRIATHTVIIPANHRFDDSDTPIRLQGLSTKGISIGDDVWIGAGVRILDGVHIGSGSVVAAGSVVTRSIPDRAVAAGVPAKVIKRQIGRAHV